MNFLTDMWNILTSLSFIDYILYFAVIVLIMLIVSLIYVIKEEQDEKMTEEENKNQFDFPLQEDLDLQTIVNTIDEKPEPLIDMTAYEEEQEKKAIISYDELINSTKNVINYDKEEMVDDLIPVKRISLNEASSSFAHNEPRVEVDIKPSSSIQLFSYEKEEEFLKTLQRLNELLN